jgi:hypothetical protein
MTDLANIAAATAAGYIRQQTDRGVQSGRGQLAPRYFTTLSKPLVGGTHQSGFEFRATGESDVSAAAADTAALAALNNQRLHRYGGGATRNKDDLGAVTVDNAS